MRTMLAGRAPRGVPRSTACVCANGLFYYIVTGKLIFSNPGTAVVGATGDARDYTNRQISDRQSARARAHTHSLRLQGTKPTPMMLFVEARDSSPY
jgi:hypothetical protein